jgi:hypothetical protein
MLAYLKTTYGNVTPNKIEKNWATLSALWNPNDDNEDLWLRIRNAQVLATIAHEPIEDATAIRLTLLSLEASGVFDFALDNWRLKDDATKTMDSFKEHFTKEDKERDANHRQNRWFSWCKWRRQRPWPAQCSSSYPPYDVACHPRQRHQDVLLLVARFEQKLSPHQPHLQLQEGRPR